MFLINKYDLLFTISILVALLPFRVSGEVVDVEQDWKSGWSVTGFNGWFTGDATITQTLKFEADLDSSYRFAGIALNKRFLTLWSRLEIEGEFQMLKHYGSQHQGEFVGLAALRWRTFPWNRWLQTGIAVGAGVSVATEEQSTSSRTRARPPRGSRIFSSRASLGCDDFPAGP